jgi:aminopeptidase N
MRRTSLLLSILLIFFSLHAKCPKKRGSKKNPKQLEELVITPQNFITSYKSSTQKLFNLLNTKIYVKPVFSEKKIYGKAEITLKPHFYDQNELVLDAKWMKINAVELISSDITKKLSYTYDSAKLKIDLEKYYTANDQIKIVVNYVAQPYLVDSMQVENGRGVYFIDVEDKNPYKPTHMWTQGEEESSSIWFPTLDATNQKSTEELFVTLDTNYISLSNGLLLDTKINSDGTKTDHWKQDIPHSPYLFFLAIGNYYKSVDSWRNKEVSAYTFPKYKDDVAKIFKNMPSMMEFFSQKLGVDFVWDKMANIIAYDYTAGAMENSSAIIYFDKLFCDRKQLLDGDFDWIIAHELFHQWFGDLVTAESWANLTLNESFADYSEYLWYENLYGKDIADSYNYKSANKYLRGVSYKNEPIINYYYDNPHDIFDEIRYEKGGRVLHMLRNYVGDQAFFTALNKYLVAYKFGNAELSDLRKIFEDVTGEDLNWFFNQWWNSKGHPILEITHQYDEKNKTIELTVRQTQTSDFGPTFRIITKVDIYVNGKKETKVIEINDRNLSFYFPSSSKPQLVNFDADKVLLCEKTEDLSESENIFKFYNATTFRDKQEALDALSAKQKDNEAVQSVFLKALQDKNWNIRVLAINNISTDKLNEKQVIIALQNIINTDEKANVRDAAVARIARIQKEKSIDVLTQVLDNDSSYATLATALKNLNYYNKAKAYAYATKLSSTESPILMMNIAKVFKDTAADNLDFFKKAIWLGSFGFTYYNYQSLTDYLDKVNPEIFEKGILFLKDIYLYEESNYNKAGAKQVVQNLKKYYDGKIKKDTESKTKLDIINKLGKDWL